MNLTGAVTRLAMDETITLYNHSAGTRIGGRWADGASVTAGITASIQVAEGEVKQLLPELLRTSESIEVFSTSELRPLKRAEGKRPSEVSWRGKRFSVEVLEDWSEHAGYWWALCAAVQQ